MPELEQPARVDIVEDDDQHRAALDALVGHMGLARRLFPSGEAFLEADRPEGRACVVLDLRLGAMNGLAVQAELNRRFNTDPVIFVTGHGDVRTAVTALRNGAFHFLEKPVDAVQFRETILAAFDTPAPMAGLADRDNPKLALLSRREQEVFAALVRGKTNKAIGADLAISARTVEFHRANILRKLGTKTLEELIALA
ncbi:MAG: response regulator transcription factor [Rhodospirillales bacterium]|nr:response regulator transcription factor [Rhodospirillales bacterium]